MEETVMTETPVKTLRRARKKRRGPGRPPGSKSRRRGPGRPPGRNRRGRRKLLIKEIRVPVSRGTTMDFWMKLIRACQAGGADAALKTDGRTTSLVFG